MVQPASPARRGSHGQRHNEHAQSHHRRGHHRPRAPIVRWSALATGSLVGIASWAFLYVFGAAVWLLLVPGPSGTHATSQIMLGVYGGVAASMALALGAHVAARVGGVSSVENALWYGACMWSFSTITLVAVAVCAATDTMGVPAGGVGALFDVGLAAVGLLAGSRAAPIATLWSMVATLILSLAFALVGALRALPEER